METKKYTELNINQRINYKSGWDIAIREAARLLICLANEEHYNDTDAFDQSYGIIAGACQAFVERK